ncbi:MAG TPA: hypothetical protein VET48_09770, partial [Steroidobacteraceae bacterium]|nr:hypothetical protein [Steroidobacteraceae bacterium]
MQNAGAAGIAFVGCNLACAVHAQAPTQSRKVVIKGRRVRTIDVHAHCAVPEAMALMGLKVTPESLLITEDRVRMMDSQGIDVAVLSINPYWYAAERDVAEKLISIQNERL